jgi:hypothetical protein
MGHCTAGGAYVPALSDYDIIVRGTGAIFLAGPPLVKAATGEEVSVEELGGADMHTSVSGTGDYFASSELHALAIARDVVARFNRIPKAAVDHVAPEPPAYDPSELYGIIPRTRACNSICARLLRAWWMAAASTNTSHGTAKRWFVALRGSTDIKSGFLPIMASCSAIAH